MLTSFRAICLRKKILLSRYLVLSPQPVYKSEQANSPSSHSGKEKRWFFALGKMTIGMTSLKFSVTRFFLYYFYHVSFQYPRKLRLIGPSAMGEWVTCNTLSINYEKALLTY